MAKRTFEELSEIAGARLRYIRELEDAVLYLAGYDVGGWDAHMRPEEVLARLNLDPIDRNLRLPESFWVESFLAHPERDGDGDS